jgi:predicted nucleic acid-binding protein
MIEDTPGSSGLSGGPIRRPQPSSRRTLNANILWKKVCLGDLTEHDAVARLDVLLGAPVVLAASHELLESALRLSSNLRHPVYGCLYLALALKRGLPLVTADERLAGIARKERKVAAYVMLLKDLPD